MGIESNLRKEGIKVIEELDKIKVNTIAKNVAQKIVVAFPELDLKLGELFIKLSQLKMYYAEVPKGFSEANYFYKNTSIYFNKEVPIDKIENYAIHECIHYLQEKYKGQIEIESGFEFEYSNRDLAHLQELKSKTDKMVLGQHFVIDGDGKEYGIARENGGKQISDEVLDLYAESIISAMDKGLPDVIAHPDLFMQARDSFGTKEEKITRAICRKAIEKGIPLEINFGKIASKIESEMPLDELKKRIPYPSPEFWKIVAEETRIAKEKRKRFTCNLWKRCTLPRTTIN